MFKNRIAPDAVQDLFDSARNAGQKGLAQYFTPPEVARALAAVLAPFRPVVTDLQCGDFGLAEACANSSTTVLLGCDLTKVKAPGSKLKRHFVKGDSNKLYPYLRNTGWFGDIFALNPGWDLFQPRAPLARLAQSDLPAVREAFAEWDGRTPRDCIDSCVAALCVALDRCSDYGEGFLIGNRSTLFRLILNAHAPHCALRRHIWGLVELDGVFGVDAVALFFAREEQEIVTKSFGTWRKLPPTHTIRLNRIGIEPGPNFRTEDSLKTWKAAVHGFEEATAQRTSQFNIWLNPDGTIGTHLSIYEECNVEIPKNDAIELHSLRGQKPMQLVLQKPTRAVLAKHTSHSSYKSPWKIAPNVANAVRQALEDYETQRAPLWPLTPTMRLGWLDEEDSIRCLKDLRHESRTIFRAGHSYPLKTTTIAVTRANQSRNIEGELEDVELTGKELAYHIIDEANVTRTFRAVRENEVREMDSLGKVTTFDHQSHESHPAPFSLEQLLEHFEMPDVKDIASVQPQRYQEMQMRLRQLEQLTEQIAA